eukprot:scaffold30096_cov69-Phaeocystis_antarctica.AAC.3
MVNRRAREKNMTISKILPRIGAVAGAVVIVGAQEWLQPKFLRELLHRVALRVELAINLPRGVRRDVPQSAECRFHLAVHVRHLLLRAATPVATVQGRARLDELLQHFRCRYGRQKGSVQSRMEQEVRANEDPHRQGTDNASQDTAERAEDERRDVLRDPPDETDAPQSYPRAARMPHTTLAARRRLRGLRRRVRAGIVSRRGGDLLTRGHVDNECGGGAVVRDEEAHAHNCRGR